MLGAIGGFLSGVGAVGSLFGGGKKAPRIPAEAMWGMGASKDLAQRQMRMHDLLSKDFLAAIPEIRTGYDEYREGLQGIIDQFSEEGPLKDWRDKQLGKIEQYDQAESNLIRRVGEAGSDERIAEKRNLARQDAMAAIGQLVDTTRSRQVARGMGGGRGGGVLDPAYADRVAHRAGRQVYDAGEAERRYGLALQTQLYPMIASGAQRSIDNYMMPQNLMTHKAGSHARQAATVDAAGLPMNRAAQGAVLALGNLGTSTGGVHQAQLEQFAMDQESTGSFFDTLGGFGDDLSSGKYDDLFGKLGDIFGDGGGGTIRRTHHPGPGGPAGYYQ